MPEEPHFLKRNDTADYIERTLRGADGGPANLTGALIKFSMRVKPGGATKISVVAATIVSAGTGRVRYSFSASDTDIADEFEGEFQATFSNGDVQTFPNDGFIPIFIEDDIA